MSEQAVTTTSFIDSSNDGICKQPISSNSSIDSGCNSSTNESINSGSYQSGIMSNHATIAPTSLQMRQSRADYLQMLPPQPNVPPPPPPPQLQESFYGTSDESTYISQSNNRLSIYGQTQPVTSNHANQLQGSNTYGAYPVKSQSILPNTNRPSIQLNPLILTSTAKAQHSSQPQQTFQQSVISQRSSTSSLESNASNPLLMPVNVKAMLLHGVPSEEVLRNWLSSIKCDDHIENFMYHGYDMHLVTRMTPQDLAAIGCKSPLLRKKLSAEIRKLNLEYELPEFDPATSLLKWLEALKLSNYYSILMKEGCDTIDKACQLTWEDLEEIGITRLGHQKRLLIAIDKIRRTAKQQETSQHDCAIYDVHPNHRVSLNGALSEHRFGTVGRVRSGVFQTRSGANLDHRGLPVATVTPALKHISSPMIKNDNNNIQQVYMQVNDSTQSNNDAQHIYNGNSNMNGVDQAIYETSNVNRMENLNLGDLGPATMRRNPPPLPPVRTNSLRVSDMSSNTFASTNEMLGQNQINNATSFLRVPKLGTLTATTNKMLASGGHIQTLSSNGQLPPMSTRSIYSPVREAPLPPTQQYLQQQQHQQFNQQQHMIQSAIPENIDEETCTSGATGLSDDAPISCSNPIGGCTYNQSQQLIGPDEFPPPPPCQ